MEEIIKLLFKAANMRRWNDHISPVKLVELDKQAHKMIIVYILAKIEESHGNTKLIWVELIEKFLFELFYRLMLTDLKPQIFHEMVKDKKEDLDSFVIDSLSRTFDNNKNFFDKFKKYLKSDKDSIEDKIINASHYLATNWEFNIIYHSNSFIHGIDKTKSDIEERIEEHFELEGVKTLLLSKKTYGFVDLCGQLRFQKRWSQTPRVPETSVLGHMLIVAIISYFLTINFKEDPNNKRIYNNFFGGLFHDLPEVLTKDIISPIKRSVEGLESLITNYEDSVMEKEIKPLIPEWFDEISYLTKNEFENKIVENDDFSNISFKSSKDMDNYNDDKFNPVDGELIKFADKLTAYTEAKISIHHGLTSDDLENAVTNLKEELSENEFNIDLKKI